MSRRRVMDLAPGRSWWPDYAGWLAERCGEEKPAPGELGSGGLVPLCDAPGMYVYDH